MRVHDKTLVTYASIKTKDLFATSFYARVYLLLDKMSIIRKMLRGQGEFEGDPQVSLRVSESQDTPCLVLCRGR